MVMLIITLLKFPCPYVPVRTFARQSINVTHVLAKFILLISTSPSLLVQPRRRKRAVTAFFVMYLKKGALIDRCQRRHESINHAHRIRMIQGDTRAPPILPTIISSKSAWFICPCQ